MRNFGLLALALLCTAPWLSAAEKAPAQPEKIRELFVPFSQLNVLLENQPRRVLLSREEYDTLVQQAKKAPKKHAPQAAVLISADYDVSTDPQRARITGTLWVDVLEDGLHAVPLDLGGVGLLSAKLDGHDAPIGRADDGQLNLLVEGAGRHRLALDMVAPLETTAAQQVLNFRWPRSPVGRLQLTVPGDVEIKSGADVASRRVDEAARVTRFELLPRAGDATILMSLNSHLQRREQAVAARCVLVDEVTEAYERLHATVTLAVLHRAVDRFRFVVPEGFEITEIASPLMARWDVETESGRKVANVRLREQTVETVVLSIAAVKTPCRLADWQLPRIELLDVVGQVTVVGLLAQEQLKVESLAAEGLIAIDTRVLARAMPAVAVRSEQGSLPLRAVAAYYAPQSQYALTAKFIQPEAEMAVTTNLLLVVEEKGCEVRGGFALLPEREKRFGFDLSVPVGWQVTGVTGPGEKPLAMETYEGSDRSARVHVRLSEGIPPRQQYQVNFHAVGTPPGWMADWKSMPIVFPAFAVLGASRDEGAVAVACHDDMAVRPDRLDRLVPLTEPEKAKYGLANITTNLAYRYDRPGYKATLLVDRTQPRLTARTFSFLQIKPDGLTAHYELIYRVDEARTRRLALLLPAATPEALAIRGLGGVVVKESSSELLGKWRRWNVLLSEGRRDDIALAVDFQQPLPSHGKKAEKADKPSATQELQGFGLPLVRAEGVVYQSGLVAVEGSPELDVQVKTTARRADIGQLAAAEYQPGRRLLGAFGFVGAPPTVSVDVFRHPGYPLTSAIAEHAELTTRLSADGTSQTQAEFQLRTKALYLEVRLPDEAELWSVELDGEPLKPQREGGSRLVGLPAGPPGVARELQLVYAEPVARLALGGRVSLPAPKLLLRTGRESPAVEVPLVNLIWHLRVPAGYDVVQTRGTLVTQQMQGPTPALFTVAGALYVLGGGTDLFWGSMMPRECRHSENAWGYKSGDKSAASAMTSAAPSFDERIAKDEEKPDGLAVEDRSVLRKKAGELLEKATKELTEAKSTAKFESRKAGELPIAYPGRKEWTELDARRKDKFKESGLSVNPTLEKPVLAAGEDRKHRMGDSNGRDSLDLAGVRSLKIDVQADPDGDQRMVTFESLGVDPELVVTLAHRSRCNSLGWALALAVGLVGIAMTGSRVRRKIALVLGVAVVAVLVSLCTDNVAVARVCNMAFFAASLLVPYYLLACLVRWIAAVACRAVAWLRAAPAGAAVLIFLVVCGLSQCVTAADPPEVKVPVVVPDDAIILPYDPKSPKGIRDADRLLVPYDRYVELWNLAHPDKKIETRKAPLPFALAGASYSAVLEGDEYLLLTGHLDVNVFAEGYASVPLTLRGGVLARAELDGKPARLSVVSGEHKESGPVQQAANSAASALVQRPEGTLLLLHVSGKGPHKLDVEVRLRLNRQGGWRVAEGLLPAAPASALSLRVPAAGTEVRLGQPADRRTRETARADETLETALGGGGEVSIQWRPKVAEAQVDRGLTAQSAAMFDVEEDGLRLVWRLSLEFRRSQREQFTLSVPKDYLVEKVAGNNVRGWEVRKNEKDQSVEITLLKTAKDTEQFTLFLWRGGEIGQQREATFDVPLVTVRDAALSSGQLTIRRSPLLDLRTVDRSGVMRIDLGGELPDLSGGPGTEESVLRIRPYEAYHFATMPLMVRLAASPVAGKATADVQTLVKAAEYEPSLESRVVFHVKDRPVYCLRLTVPADLRRPQVSVSCPCQWAITEREKQRVLSVYLTEGQQGDVPLLLTGMLGAPGADRKFPLPQIAAWDVQRQQGSVAVQADPAFDVEAHELTGCQEVARGQMSAWLNPQQREATRLAVQTRGSDYSGMLRLVPRKADVTCDTISNVRVTDRAVETTVFLNFAIRGAGIRELSFLLPAWMADSRIAVPMLRQKTIEPYTAPVAAGEGKKSEALVRVRVELQDDVMNAFRILVQSDRMLTSGAHAAPIPIVQTGRTNRQYVTLETAGRDELVVESLAGMEPLSRQQKEWQMLSGLLGNHIYQAYMVSPGAEEPRLALKTVRHEDVKTAGARIDLAQTVLVLDRNGAYRAEVALSLDNATEQFLAVELPAGATLWTVHVAGEPAKPTEVPGAAGAGRVLVPILKTARGDLNHSLVLKYGGKMAALGQLGSVRFPLVRTVKSFPGNESIGIERSLVEVYVPDTYEWFDFGGTMHAVQEEADLQAGIVAYQTKQAQRLIETARQGDPFAKVRALGNLKVLKEEMEKSQSSFGFYSNSTLQTELNFNADMLRQAQEQLKEQDQSRPGAAQAEAYDNRGRLNDLYDNQTVTRSRNVINNLGQNWSEATPQRPSQQPSSGVQFNEQWLDKNRLIAPEKQDKSGKSNEPGMPRKPQSKTDVVPVDPFGAQDDGRRDSFETTKTRRGIVVMAADDYLSGKKAAAPPTQPAMPAIAQGVAQSQLEQAGQQQAVANKRLASRNQQQEEVLQYQQKLKQQQGGMQSFARDQQGIFGAGGQGAGMGGGMGGMAPSGVTAGFEAKPSPVNGPMPAASTPSTQLLGHATRDGKGEAKRPADAPAEAQAPAAAAVTGLASLDFELPKQGRVYRFSTPRGEVELTARAVSNELLAKLGTLAMLIAGVLVAWYVVRVVERGGCAWLRRPSGALLLIVLGLLMIVVGVLPVAAVAMSVIGGVLIVSYLWTRRNR